MEFQWGVGSLNTTNPEEEVTCMIYTSTTHTNTHTHTHTHKCTIVTIQLDPRFKLMMAASACHPLKLSHRIQDMAMYIIILS